MINRIQSLLDLFDLSERFIVDERTELTYSAQKLHQVNFKKYEIMKTKSVNYLCNALKKNRGLYEQQ